MAPGVIIDGMKALRLTNHLLMRLRQAPPSDEDLRRLEEVREWIRGMVAIDQFAAMVDRSDSDSSTS